MRLLATTPRPGIGIAAAAALASVNPSFGEPVRYRLWEKAKRKINRNASKQAAAKRARKATKRGV